MGKPVMSLNRPSTTPAKASPAPATGELAREVEEGQARIVVDVPAGLHRRLKIRAAERRQSIKALVLAALEKDIE